MDPPPRPLPVVKDVFCHLVPGRAYKKDDSKAYENECIQLSANQYGFSIPLSPHFSHVVVFLGRHYNWDKDMGAAVYIEFPGQAGFKLLGAIGPEKPSAVFKVNYHVPENLNNYGGDAMLDASSTGSAAPELPPINIGISVEPQPSIDWQLQSLGNNEAPSSTALVRPPLSTKVLAQRIIRNAFNFLASFAGGSGAQEVVPLKSFQDWWTKFERRIENDPTFLEREDDGT